MNVSLAETQISIRGAERKGRLVGREWGGRTAAALGEDKEKQCRNTAIVQKMKARGRLSN